MRILVTDGDTRAALAVVRALGAQGHTVDVVAARPGSLAGVSRFAARTPGKPKEPVPRS